MYPNELKQYINDRNGMLTPDEIKFATDINLHCQINHITYNPWCCNYNMWDRYGNHYHFGVKNIL